MLTKNWLLFLIISFIFISSPHNVFADISSFGTATPLPIVGSSVKDGDIISSGPNGYQLSIKAYDPLMVGVVSLNPAVYLNDLNQSNSKPVIPLGKTYVRVSTINGAIKQGDLITSSTVPGVGQKSTDNGYVLGVAEEDYGVTNPKIVGEILVAIYPHYNQQSANIARIIFSTISFGLTSAFLTPIGTLRYFIAGFIVLVAFFFGFNLFGRASARGIEAIGRNPLAGRVILLSILLNVISTIAVIGLGVAIGYIILVL